ncbi:unnamed protein product, partial [Ectocarpus sp. 13 AM-2016]
PGPGGRRGRARQKPRQRQRPPRQRPLPLLPETPLLLEPREGDAPHESLITSKKFPGLNLSADSTAALSPWTTLTTVPRSGYHGGSSTRGRTEAEALPPAGGLLPAITTRAAAAGGSLKTVDASSSS